MSRGDFTPAARDYAAHRAGFPASFFERLGRLGIGMPGQRVVDLGTGTGAVARGLAARGCEVIGIDLSEAMLEAARRLAAAAGLTIDYRHGTAESTGLPPGIADVVASGQSWHWFDVEAASAEAARLLKPSGILMLARFDWLPLPDSVPAATEALILQMNPGWGMAGTMGLQPHWLRDLGARGWTGLESFSYDETVRYTHEAWRGRARACNGVGVDLSPDEVARFDERLAALLKEQFPQEPMEVLHRIFVVTARRRAVLA